MRARGHVGSSLELEYALRSFGIDFSNMDDDDYVNKMIEADICKRQRLEDEWRKSEAPYREPSSPFALFPNPQDIIMGKNRLVARTWSGNVMFQRLIQDNVHRYMEAQMEGWAKIDKTLLAIEILQILQNEHKARFLSREKTRWVTVSDAEAQKKITQSLRSLARERNGRWRD